MRGWEVRTRCYLHVVLWAVLAVSNPTFAAPLNLTLDQVTDISAMNFGGVGGLTYDPILGQLWISDAAGDGSSPTPGNTNKVALIDPLTGGVVTDFDASAGNVFRGPDGVALEPATGHLFLFSAFLDITAGVTTAAGVTVRTLTIPLTSKYAGAAFNSLGQLWVADRPNLTTAKDNLFQLDPLTGTTTSTVLIKGASFNPNLSGLAFDPVTGNPFAYDTDQQVLLEIDLTTGVVQSETPVGSFFAETNVPGGIAFNDTGDKLYLGSGASTGSPLIASELIVLNRFSGVAIPIPGAIWLMSGALAGLAAYRRKP